MKFRVYIVKKQQLIWAAIILALVIIMALVLFSMKTKSTFTPINSTKTYHIDLDNDGRSDSIVISTDKETGEFAANVITKEGNGYFLEPDPTIKTLGYNTKWWPMNFMAEDINKDGNTEIVLQSGDKLGPILHIFRYNSGKIERLASGRYSIFGTLNPPGENSTIIVLGSKRNDAISFTFLQTKAGKMFPYVAPTSLVLGKNTLSALLTFIEKNDVEASTINIENKYVSKISKGEFLDCSFSDVKYTKYNIPTEFSYIIRSTKLNGDDRTGEIYKIKMQLTKYDEKNPDYRITNISKLN